MINEFLWFVGFCTVTFFMFYSIYSLYKWWNSLYEYERLQKIDGLKQFLTDFPRNLIGFLGSLIGFFIGLPFALLWLLCVSSPIWVPLAIVMFLFPNISESGLIIFYALFWASIIVMFVKWPSFGGYVWRITVKIYRKLGF